MSDPSRPSGEPGSDPTAPYSPPSYTLPGEKPGGESAPQESPPAAGTSGAGAGGAGGYTMPSGASDYGQPPTSDPAGYAPPPSTGSGAYTPPPTSGAGTYAPPPTSGPGAYTPPQTGYGAAPGGYQPTSGAGYGPSSGGPAYPGYPAAPASGYGQAPGGYPAGPAGYPAAGYGQPPAGYANNDEKTYAMIAHWGGVAGWFIGAGLLGWVGPLIAYLGKGTESPTVRAHSVTALNFHLTWTGAYVVGWILAFCTFGISVFAAWLIPVIFGIIGSVKATNGEYYRYPMAIPFLK